VIRGFNAAPLLRDVSIYTQVDRSTDRECSAGLMDSLRQVRHGLATETTLEQCREDAWDQWTTLDAKLKQIYDSVVGDIGRYSTTTLITRVDKLTTSQCRHCF